MSMTGSKAAIPTTCHGTHGYSRQVEPVAVSRSSHPDSERGRAAWRGKSV